MEDRKAKRWGWVRRGVTTVLPGQDSNWHLRNVGKGVADRKDWAEPRKIWLNYSSSHPGCPRSGTGGEHPSKLSDLIWREKILVYFLPYFSDIYKYFYSHSRNNRSQTIHYSYPESSDYSSARSQQAPHTPGVLPHTQAVQKPTPIRAENNAGHLLVTNINQKSSLAGHR